MAIILMKKVIAENHLTAINVFSSNTLASSKKEYTTTIS